MPFTGSTKVEYAFNVFMCHNSKGKSIVRELKLALAKAGLSCWLDEDELRPGIPWQQCLEEGIKASQSVAVLVGKDGIGPWATVEMRSALDLAVKDKRSVIPVILPGVTEPPEFPLFFSGLTCVDLRPAINEENLGKLIWGITGIQPKKQDEKLSINPPTEVAAGKKLSWSDPPDSPELKLKIARRTAMFVDKQKQATEALEMRVKEKLSAFVFICDEEEWPEAVSYRIAFELAPSPEDFREPIHLRLKPNDLIIHGNSTAALQAKLFKLYSSISGERIDTVKKLEPFLSTGTPQVFYLNTYATDYLYFKAAQLKDLFQSWEQSIAQQIDPPPCLVVIVEYSKVLSPAPKKSIFGGWFGKRGIAHESFETRYLSELDTHNLHLHILSRPIQPTKDHIKEWLDNCLPDQIPWMPEKDALEEAACGLFLNQSSMPHFKLGQALIALLVATD